MGETYDRNLYRFVYGSPLKYVDPDGLWGIAFGNADGSSYVNFGNGDPTLYFGPDSGDDLAESAAAVADGMIPFVDPFANNGVYDPNDPYNKFSKGAGVVATCALSGAGALKAAGISTRIAMHGPHHPFPWLGKLPHIQLNWWRAGVKGSGGAVRIPVPPATPGFPSK